MIRSNTIEVGDRYDELLRSLGDGSVTLVRNGMPVAQLSPVAPSDPQRIRNAMARIRAFRASHDSAGVSIKSLIEEGRM